MTGGGGGDAQQVQPTQDQKTQQQINAEMWNYYQTDYKPVVDKYIAKTTDPTMKAEEKAQVAGQINAETMKTIDPSKFTNNAVANAKTIAGVTKAETGAKVQGQGNIRSRQLGSMQNIIDIGRGQATTAQAGTDTLAGESVQQEIASMDIKNQENAAVENAYGSAVGAAGALAFKAGTSGGTAGTGRQYTPDLSGVDFGTITKGYA